MKTIQLKIPTLMKIHNYFLVALFATTLSCAKTDEAKNTESVKSEEHATSHQESKSSFPNFRTPTNEHLQNLQLAQKKLGDLVGAFAQVQESKDNLFIQESAKISIELWHSTLMLANMETIVAEEGGDSLTDVTSLTLIKAYLTALRGLNSSIDSLTNAGTYEPAIEQINVELLNTMTFLKQEIYFKRFKEFDSAGGSVAKIAELLKVKL